MRMAVTPLSMVSLYTSCDGACVAMLIVCRATPKSLRNRVTGTITMASWFWPKEEPLSPKVPMTV